MLVATVGRCCKTYPSEIGIWIDLGRRDKRELMDAGPRFLWQYPSGNIWESSNKGFDRQTYRSGSFSCYKVILENGETVI